ncbi:hypothetical protein MNBD_BACTEROID05-383 [hydrothermal vent metagenome]|uniref:Uncharacterized protein n=1 Tax=hydrothermal vent metagenome TaxID=652676 RepID=A0A3B0TXF5_9ZZZZ
MSKEKKVYKFESFSAKNQEKIFNQGIQIVYYFVKTFAKVVCLSTINIKFVLSSLKMSIDEYF